jgi:hypothetical protein
MRKERKPSQYDKKRARDVESVKGRNWECLKSQRKPHKSKQIPWKNNLKKWQKRSLEFQN